MKSNPGSGTLNGTLTVNASAGVATFSGLTIDQAANGYTIQATTTGLSSATTNAFDITPAAASQLVVTTQPPASTTAGNSFGLDHLRRGSLRKPDPFLHQRRHHRLEEQPRQRQAQWHPHRDASAGVATFSGLTLDQAANGYTIQATTTGLSSATTNAFDITPAATSQLVVTTQPPASITAGTSFGLTVSGEDRYGNVTPSFTSDVSIALKHNPGKGTLNGVTEVNASDGVATFSGLTLDKAANGYTIQATTTGLSSATTKSFNITPAAATQLVVTTQPPASVRVFSPFGLAVSAEDRYGNVVKAETGSVTIALKNNPGHGTLSGRLTISFSSGVAKFSGLRLNKPGDGYTIKATSTKLTPAITDPFNVTDGDAPSVGLVLATQPSRGIAIDSTLSPVGSGSDKEDFGNAPTTTYGSTLFTLTSNPGSNGTTVVDIGPLTMTDSNGMTSLPAQARNKPGKGSGQPARP